MRIRDWALVLATIAIVAGLVALYFSVKSGTTVLLPAFVEPPGGEYAMLPQTFFVVFASGRVIAIGANDTTCFEYAPVAPLVAIAGGLPNGSAVVVGSVAVGNISGPVYALYAVTARDYATGANITVWACCAMRPVPLGETVAMVPALFGPGDLGEAASACSWLARAAGMRWDGLVWSGAVSVEPALYAEALLSAIMMAQNGSAVPLALASKSACIKTPGRYVHLAPSWTGSNRVAVRDVLAIAVQTGDRPLKVEVRAEP